MKIQHRIKSALVIALCITPLAQAEESVSEEPIKVLQIVGENHHDYENQKVIIAEGVSKRVNSTWTTLHHKTKEAAKEYLDSPDFAKGYDVVLYNICHAREPDAEFI